MTETTKRKLRQRFFRSLGPNAKSFKAAMDCAESLCMNMKDAQGRIMALNRKNCEVCNIKNEWDAIGLKSTDLFSPKKAETYMTLDRETLTSRKPILNRITEFPADDSDCFMISNLFPLQDLNGETVGTLHVYRLSRDIANSSKFKSLHQVVDHIQRNFASNISVDSLACLAKMSLSTFKRAFSKNFEMSPSEYIQITRLNAARRLLETTDKLIADIAAETGFFDQSHFTRTFKKERGMTPGEYRHRHRAIRGPATSNRISRP